jgi:HAAS domain-containing protein
MTTTTMHPLAADYLQRLERAGRRLPRAERSELIDEISAHLAEATSPEMSDAETLSVLGRLGDPEDIVEAQLPARGERRGTQEWAAIFLLLFGGFLVVIGWIAGVVLLWGSRAWSTRDKLIGTLIFPGGLALFLPAAILLGTKRKCAAINGVVQRCTPGPSTAHSIVSTVVLICLVIGPICASVYLARRAR